jgi:hypothetical protein
MQLNIGKNIVNKKYIDKVIIYFVTLLKLNYITKQQQKETKQ